MRENIVKKVLKEVEEKITIVTCCLCGQKAARAEAFMFVSWEEDKGYCNDVRETCIMLDEGAKYPEGGHGTRTIIDICPECFKAKLIPWIKEQGGTVEEEDWED